MNTEEAKVDANLILFKKDGSTKSFVLPSNITVIGRRHDCDLCVPLMVVSRRHCQLSQNNETVKIRDLDSKGGTYLNGNRISEATVKAGDYITIGPLTFLLQIDGEPAKIVPPQPPKAPSAAKKEPAPKAPAEDLSGSFPELEIDDSDSFLAELEDL
jgi:pSer/pThr/pTyr-binding forkhead associated (FHA) protein